MTRTHSERSATLAMTGAYSGKRTIDPRIVYPLQHFVAILPKSITFSPAQAGIYQGHPPPDQPDGIAQIANNPDPTQKLAFEVSGTGVFQSQEQASGGAAHGQSK